MPIKVPASENMLPKSKDGWKPHTTMFFKKFLQQIPHFEGFFHIIILLKIYLIIWLLPKKLFPQNF